MLDKEFLYKYLHAHAPSGFEGKAIKIWEDKIEAYVDQIQRDKYGSSVAIINPTAPFKIVIEAHVDEIGWYVNYINKQGYIYVIRNGGSDHQIAPSMRATLYTEEGDKWPAVFGWPAIHVRKGDKNPKIELENIFLDAGFSSDTVATEKNVQPGTWVSFNQQITEIGDFLTAKALDNRIGGYMLVELAQKIASIKKKLPFGVYFVNAVQEEVGLKGASMMAHRLQPNVALIIDVTHDTQSPLYNKIKQGNIACGKGPVIMKAPSIHNLVRKKLIESAKKNKVTFQYGATSHGTGTDTDAFAYTGKGIPSALLSVPLKYMHTTVEMVHKDDVIDGIDLLSYFIKNFSLNIFSNLR